jgi:hypothetical protein
MTIADFILEKMSSYVAGGMVPESAARFTSGELGSIYWEQHFSRNNYGIMRKTPLPENIDIETASRKCKAAINEILDACAEMAKEKKEYSGKAPEETPQAPQAQIGASQPIVKKNGLEGLKNYVRGETA